MENEKKEPKEYKTKNYVPKSKARPIRMTDEEVPLVKLFLNVHRGKQVAICPKCLNENNIEPTTEEK